MRAVLVVTVLTLVWLTRASGDDPPASSSGGNLERVRALFDAFNAHDPGAMMAHVTDDIQWLSVSGDQISIETTGVESLRTAMKSYFASTPGVRSTIEDATVSGSFVALREHVRWQTETGEKSQEGLAVYEVRVGKIRRVWYFTEEK